MPNVTNVETLTRRFNGALEGKVLVVCNEMQSVENARFINADSMKLIITEYKMMYENKFVKVR